MRGQRSAEMKPRNVWASSFWDVTKTEFTVALDCTHHNMLVLEGSSIALATLFSADIGFVDFHRSAERSGYSRPTIDSRMRCSRYHAVLYPPKSQVTL